MGWFDDNAPRMTNPGADATGGGPAATGTAPNTWSGAGGGWNDPNVQTPSSKILQQAFAQGLTGQQAVDWATQHGAPNIAYYPDKNQYGLPDGAYIAPNPQNPGKLDLISRPSGGGGGGGDGFGSTTAPGAYGPRGFQGPVFQPGPFQAPTGLDYTNDPGYLARMRMGTDAIQNAAAAKGSILSGGTLKALERYGQDYGSNEFSNVYGRALSGFGANLQAGQTGFENQLAAQGFTNQAGQTGYLNRYGQFTDYLGQLNLAANRGLSASAQRYQVPPAG